MKVVQITVITFLFSFCFIAQQVHAQGNLLLKYSGKWQIEELTAGATFQRPHEILEINSKGRIFWNLRMSTVDPNTGEPMDVLIPCEADSVAQLTHAMHSLRDTVVIQPVDDLGGTQKNNAWTYKGAIVYSGVQDKNVDVFRFKTKCIQEVQDIELIFYSEKKALIMYHYLNKTETAELIKL